MSENDYYEQPANQEEAVRPEVNMLPCPMNVKFLYWIMTGTFILVILLRELIGLYHYNNPFSDYDGFNPVIIIFSILSAISGVIFFSLFARGCRKLRNAEYIYSLCLVVLPIAQQLSSLIFVDRELKTVISIITWILYIFCCILAVLLANSFRKEYEGKLSDLGDMMWGALKVLLVVTIVIVLLSLLVLYTYSGIGIFVIYNNPGLIFTIIIGSGLTFYFFYVYFKALWQACIILEAGHMYHFTDAGLEAILDGKTFIPPILDTATNDGTSSTAPPASAGAPKEPGGWSRLHSWARFLIIFGGVLAVTGIIFLIAKVSDKGHARDDYNDLHEDLYENYDDGEEDNEHSDQIYNEDDENYNPYVEYEGKPLPWWLPDNIREDLESSNYVFTHSDGDMSLSDTYRGNINDSEIVMELSYESDGTVTGRYAYESTLSRYGYGDSSWYKLRGAVFFAEASYPRVVLRSYAPDSGKLFEYFDLTDEDMTLNGTMFNVRHRENPTKSLYRVYLER